MMFLAVVVLAQLFEQHIGRLDLADALGTEEHGQAVLPVVVQALDFAFGLRSGGVLEAHTVEVQSAAQLGEGVGCVV